MLRRHDREECCMSKRAKEERIRRARKRQRRHRIALAEDAVGCEPVSASRPGLGCDHRMCDSIRAEHALQKRQGSLVRRWAKTVDAKDPSGIGKREGPPRAWRKQDHPPGENK